MRTSCVVLGMFSCFFLACSSPKPEGESSSPADTSAVVKSSQKDKPTQTVLGFLNWYRENLDTLATIPLVKNNPPSEDSTKFYAVDFEAAKHYLAEMKKSGFVSDQYIKSQQEYFQKADENFAQNKQNDGPPDNFDFDLVMLSQDIDDDLKNSAQAKVLSYKLGGNTVSLVIGFKSGSKLRYWLTKHGDTYLIDAIEFPSSEN